MVFLFTIILLKWSSAALSFRLSSQLRLFRIQFTLIIRSCAVRHFYGNIFDLYSPFFSTLDPSHFDRNAGLLSCSFMATIYFIAQVLFRIVQ